jgi:hypothetical protein
MAAFAVPAITEGALVIVEGILWCTGVAVAAFVGEKVADVATRENDSTCCCGLRGPSGKFKQHFILKSSRKKAEDAARNYPGADSVEHHTGTAQGVRPHFHPVKDGVKIPGVHFEYTK